MINIYEKSVLLSVKPANLLVFKAESPGLWIFLAFPVGGNVFPRIRVNLFVSEPAMSLVVRRQVWVVEVHNGFVTWVEHSTTNLFVLIARDNLLQL